MSNLSDNDVAEIEQMVRESDAFIETIIADNPHIDANLLRCEFYASLEQLMQEHTRELEASIPPDEGLF